MRLIHSSIRYPVSTAVGVILVVMFGLIGLARMPIQLTPEVRRPQITVTTVWPGASPHEVETEIVNEQEEHLKSLEGLTRMRSASSDSTGQITLQFRVGTDLDGALLRVSNRLDQVPQYPQDAEKPVLTTVDTDATAMAWFVLAPLHREGDRRDIAELRNFTEDFIRPELERVPGVAGSNIYGGRERELQVIVDPDRLAARGITLTDLGAALERENRNYSGGSLDEGKRRYIVRTVGQYGSPEEVESIVVAVRDRVTILLEDVARVELGYRKSDGEVYNRGTKVLAFNAVPSQKANVLETMEGIREALTRLNDGLLKERGLRITQVYDQTDYITSAIDLVRGSLLFGGILAIAILLLFLRSFASTLVIAVSIPVSLIGTFILMWAFGRTINVVSLAGMAFAVGMVVDNSIVILENIYRHRQMGKGLLAATQEGAGEVWGAVLASTLTTMAVFIPVVFIEDEVGQLFGDIALALATSVGLSLIVSITVIPCLAARLIHAAEADESPRGAMGLWGGVRLANRTVEWVRDTVHWITGSTGRRLLVAGGATAVSLVLTFALLPPTEYLPAGNQNFLFGLLFPPPGYSIGEVSTLKDLYDLELKPLWSGKPGTPEVERTPGGGIREFFFVAANNIAFVGVSSNDPMRVRELIPEFQRANAKVPGAFAFIDQFSIFQGGFGEGRGLDVEFSGPDLPRLMELGREAFLKVPQVLPGAQARPVPSLDLENPEVHVRPHRQRAAELGLSNRDLGFAVRALVYGAKASDYLDEGREIDLVVKAEVGEAHRTHLLEQMPIAVPGGALVTLGAVTDVRRVNGPVEIDHSERQRTVRIVVQPRPDVALKTAMDVVQTQILGPMADGGRLGGPYQARLSGTADKLVQAWRALFWNFLLVLAITYLLMAALFESFLYPFVIMFSVPLAAVGGVLGLALLHAVDPSQQLDVITMLGFVILVGTVVNNAILIVHQSLNHMRDEGRSSREAIREATGNRIRPIVMTVGTSVLGMLPLVLFPGAGSEIYRGLGSVVVGGLITSTVFTLFVVPAVFSLSLDARESVLRFVRSRVRRGPGLEPAPPRIGGRSAEPPSSGG